MCFVSRLALVDDNSALFCFSISAVDLFFDKGFVSGTLGYVWDNNKTTMKD